MNSDTRPQRAGWAPGNYTNRCHICKTEFIGDKRAVTCAQCAYGNSDTLEKLRDDMRGEAVALAIVGKNKVSGKLTFFADRLDAIMAKPDIDALRAEYEQAEIKGWP